MTRPTRSGLRPPREGSSDSAAESSSLYYGRLPRLLLLPTPPLGDAVTLSFRLVGKPGEDLHLPGRNALTGAPGRTQERSAPTQLHAPCLSDGVLLNLLAFGERYVP